MFYYAHSRKLPLQIIITRGKEFVMSEKHMRAGHGATLVTYYSNVIESKDFAEFEAFAAEVGIRFHDDGHMHVYISQGLMIVNV